jgi:hypothetical protein
MHIAVLLSLKARTGPDQVGWDISISDLIFYFVCTMQKCSIKIGHTYQAPSILRIVFVIALRVVSIVLPLNGNNPARLPASGPSIP